jgi:hypothetical protein
LLNVLLQITKKLGLLKKKGHGAVLCVAFSISEITAAEGIVVLIRQASHIEVSYCDLPKAKFLSS